MALQLWLLGGVVGGQEQRRVGLVLHGCLCVSYAIMACDVHCGPSMLLWYLRRA